MSPTYMEIVVESYLGEGRGQTGDIRIRPAAGQFYPQTLNVECSRSLRTQYPVGTKFRIRVKLTDMQGTPFLYSHHRWPVVVLSN